jgi:hypothetical protein
MKSFRDSPQYFRLPPYSHIHVAVSALRYPVRISAA